MAFGFTINRQTVFGNVRVCGGTYYSDGGDTGGVIETGLDRVEYISLTPLAAAPGNSHVVSNATVPYSPDITIITPANANGLWVAYGL